MEDTYKHKGLRRKLVNLLKEKGIKDKNVLKAIEKIPRHFFFDPALVDHAYQDKAFPIGEGQTISQPYTVAFQTQLLEISPGEKVLEIGTGSGYQAAILEEMGAKVYTIETNPLLHKKVKGFLPSLGYTPAFFLGDGSKGLPAYAPYDKVLVTAAAPAVPEPLLQQLKIGGFLVIPVGSSSVQKMIRLTKEDKNTIEKEEFGNFKFVPLTGEKGWRKR